MNNSVTLSCPVEVDGNPCEVDLTVTVAGERDGGWWLEDLEMSCGHVLTQVEEDYLLEEALEELTRRAEERASESREDD